VKAKICACGRSMAGHASMCWTCFKNSGLAGRPLTKPLLGNFRIDDATECWNWIGHKNNMGYGVITYRGKQRLAHRVVAALYLGLDIENLSIKGLHRCDNPPCINRKHLFFGTQADNMKDAQKKRRLAGQELTHCKHGHPFSSENTYIYRGRHCRTCHAQLTLRRYHEKREACGLE